MMMDAVSASPFERVMASLVDKSNFRDGYE